MCNVCYCNRWVLGQGSKQLCLWLPWIVSATTHRLVLTSYFSQYLTRWVEATATAFKINSAMLAASVNLAHGNPFYILLTPFQNISAGTLRFDPQILVLSGSGDKHLLKTTFTFSYSVSSLEIMDIKEEELGRVITDEAFNPHPVNYNYNSYALYVLTTQFTPSSLPACYQYFRS